MSILLLNNAWASKVRFASGGTARTSAVINKPAEATSGRLVVLSFTLNYNSGAFSIVAPAGFTTIRNTSANNGTYEPHLCVCYKFLDGSEGSTFTFTFASSTNESLLLCSVYQGVDSVGAISAASTGNSASPIALTLTTTSANSRVVFDAHCKGLTLTGVNTGYPSGTTGVVANATQNGGSSGLIYAQAYQDYPSNGSVTGSKTFTSLITTNRYWSAIAYELKAGIEKTIDSVNGGSPVVVGQTSVTINTTGLGTLVSITIGGIACPFVNAPSGSGVFTVPSFIDGAVYPSYGSVAIVASDGTNSASTSITLTSATSQAYTTISDIGTATIGYLKYDYPSLAINDVVTFDTPETLDLDTGLLNGVDVDGRFFSDFVDTQVMWVRSFSTGIMTRLDITIENEVESNGALSTTAISCVAIATISI